MKKILFFIFILIITPAIIIGIKITYQVLSKPVFKKTDSPIINDIRVIAFHSDTLPFNPQLHTKGWGYDIIINNKLYNHQPYIPTIPGFYAFKSEADAKKTGIFCAEQLKKFGLMCTAISERELDSLGISLPTIDSLNTTSLQ